MINPTPAAAAIAAADENIWQLEAATEAAASFFRLEPGSNPLVGLLAEARAHAAELRGTPPPAAGRASMATLLVDALLAAPGVVVPVPIAGLLSDAITAALTIASDTEDRMTARTTYTIEQFDAGRWTADGIGDSEGWTNRRRATAAIASLRRMGGAWATTAYRLVAVAPDGARAVVRVINP